MEQWIPVLVRLEDLSTITKLIGELESERSVEAEAVQIVGSGSTGEETGIRPAGLEGRPSWSLEDLERLARGETKTAARWALALDVCAETPEQYLGTSEVAKRSGMSIAEWRDAPRKISRHLANNFPDVPRDADGHAVWPLDARSVPAFPGEVSWAITREMADLWKQVRR